MPYLFFMMLHSEIWNLYKGRNAIKKENEKIQRDCNLKSYLYTYQ